MSILKWQVNSSSNFASFFIVMTHNSSVNFKLIHFLLWIKGSHQSPSFENFEYFGKNFPNSSCHFLNHKLAFLQILYHSSVSWNTTPLYLFSWKFYILSTKGVYQSTNSVKFHVSSWKSESLHFNEFLLSKSYNVSAKKAKNSYLSWHWIVM